MDGLAAETWLRIERGDARGIRLREDTITENHLLDLDVWHPEVIVHRFNQNTEKASGADWEWYIGTDTTWFALRIQAKRMDQLEYRQLQHPGDGTDSYQYDTLIRTSRTGTNTLETFPYYVFFNGWDAWPKGVDWYGCPNGNTLSGCSHATVLDFGCSAMPAELVRAIHSGRGAAGRKVSEYLPSSMPWSWLFPPQRKSPPLATGRMPFFHYDGDAGSLLKPFQTSSLGSGSIGPRTWGTLDAAPPNPTVHETYRWHRAMRAQMDEIEGWHEVSEDGRLDRIGTESSVRRRWAGVWDDMDRMADTWEGLGPLPRHAEALYDLRRTRLEPQTPKMRSALAARLAQAEAEMGPFPLNVAVVDLQDLGEFRELDEPTDPLFG